MERQKTQADSLGNEWYKRAQLALQQVRGGGGVSHWNRVSPPPGIGGVTMTCWRLSPLQF
jgi:hypothetical protein